MLHPSHMPTIWRFLLKEYLKVLTLCSLAFIALLILMRLEEIAQFAALGANNRHIWRFILYQLPYIIPIALPISALISSLLLMRRLSLSNELTALRSAGFGLRHILCPILLMSTFLALANFVVASELSTHAHLMKRLLRKELKSLNPLILLQSERLAHLRGVYAQTFGPGKAGESASDVLICLYNHHHDCLSLITAKELRSNNESLVGRDVTIVTPLAVNGDEFDHLLIENSASLTLPKPDLTQLLGNSGVKVENDHLQLAHLIAKSGQIRASLGHVDEKGRRHLHHALANIYSEISRRLSVALAVFTFTLLGLTYGIQVSRLSSYLTIAYVIALAAFYIACFFIAKQLDHRFVISTLLQLGSQGILIGLSLRTLLKISRGTV